ncbi:uncharacterized protein PGTG_13872 [Puccinia graminis f. sp. tritici CRL 75-36-700-3]|uniref:Uncharacterized protein n=1 Tax=Puccinia graminis f. sp. tritici (strain CRL 75-36-700-3 / race SCCL) TaxID=418459 RepID=E3KT76_PUCGT|nr:uncharacterized protein PGTG_13872 [Puccinia graminis f. sp. tritici CRL 75-36-700-3]EFP87501.2 hypothetical protein PGTG_13872 [Puccinia graminis f. sp. tritici CRL 75-36-700-3]
MFRFSILVLICSTLKYASATPTNYAVTIAPHPISFASAPILAPPIQFTLERNGHLRLRNRKVLESMPPETQHPTPPSMERGSHSTRIPSEEQLSQIKQFIRHHETGKPYTLKPDGTFAEIEKRDGTIKYYFGRVEVFDEEGCAICLVCSPVAYGLCAAGYVFSLPAGKFCYKSLSAVGSYSYNALSLIASAAYYELLLIGRSSYGTWEKIRDLRNPRVTPMNDCEDQLPGNHHQEGQRAVPT